MGYRFIYFLILASVLIINFSGCGGGARDRDGEHQDGKIDTNVAMHMRKDNKDPVLHIGKYRRDLQDNDFDLNSIDWEYDNLEGLKIHVDEKYLYLQFTHNSTAINIQFFIDIDDNPHTGNQSENGADYMVENGHLYESTDINSWKWKSIGDVRSVIKVGQSDAIAIKLSDLKNRSVIFKANAQALNESWSPFVMSPFDGRKSIYTDKHTIDWKQVPIYSTNADKKVKIFDTDDNIYIYVEQDSFPAHIQVYIDSDNNPLTGYTSGSWNNFGRDYLIEDGYLYHYNAQEGWGWEFIDTIQKIRKDADKATLEITIPKKKLINYKQKIKVGIQTNNKTWTDTILSPKGEVSEYLLKPLADEKSIEISEVMAANSHTIVDPDYFQFSDWIELHNKSNHSVDISGYKLSDTLNVPKWTIPDNTVMPPDGYLLVWADKKENEDNIEQALHCNFKLKMSGEAVALFDKSDKQIYAFEYLKQAPDLSVAVQNGEEVYMNPSPNKKNREIHSSAILSKKPTFSLEEGIYPQSRTLVLSSSENSTIYYTLDGSIPTINSTKYSTQISVDKTMSVRAISVENGRFASSVVTKSYVIGEDIDMPVVFISTDDKYLNDDTIGIYTVGTNGKDLGECGNDTAIIANYVQKWERPAHITLFEENKKAVLSQDIGISISGECSRQHAQKSFHIKADDKYGKGKFSYQIFPDKKIKKFKRFKLRNAGQDFIKAHMRDALIQTVTKNQMNLNYEAYRPSVVFLNGKYWGIYGIREKLGTEYLKENYGAKKVDFLEGDSLVKKGSADSYLQLNDYLRVYSLESNENYNYVASLIDIDNYIDYLIANIYSGNIDRAGSNLAYWKERKKGAKWKWLLHDTDFGFGLYSNYGVDHNALNMSIATDGDAWPNPQWSTLLFRKLLENSGFKSKFKARFIQQLDTTFLPNRVNGIIDQISSKLDSQIEKHIDRWRVNDQYSYAVNNKEDWKKEVEKLKDYATKRPDIIKLQLEAF